MTINELKELMETGKEFELQNSPYKFKFRGNIIWAKDEQGWHWSFVKMNDLLGSALIRKPWKPKVGEEYWAWFSDEGDFRTWVRDNEWVLVDVLNFNFGNCFRTKEECEKHTEIRDKLIEMRKEYV